MSDNKALVIITIIIFATTTIFFLALLIPSLFIKNSSQTQTGMQIHPTSLPRIAIASHSTKAVLGASVIHINRDLQLDGNAWVNGNLYLEPGALHIGDVDIQTLFQNSNKGTNTIVQQPVNQVTQEITQSGVLSLQNATGNLAFSQGDGISISGLMITNNDRGSSQNMFKTIFADGTSFSARSNTDAFHLLSGNGISLTAGNNNTITIASMYPSLSIATGAGLSGGGIISAGAPLLLTNTGVTSINGTPNQIFVSGTTGDVTVSLPQNINATASPVFTGISLSGTATTSGNISFRGGSSQVNILNGGTMGFYTSAGGDSGLGTIPALYIAGNGKVGIGTNNPGTNALQINGGTLYVNGNSNSIIADGIVRSNTLFWMSSGSTGLASVLRLENYSGTATGLSLSSKLAGSDGTETEWPYQTIIKDTSWTGAASTRNAALTFNTLFNNTSKEVLRLASSGFVGIGALSPLATLDIRSQSGIASIASISGRTSYAGFVVDNSGNGSLFTASSAGQTRFAVDNLGNTRIVASLCVKANFASNCSGNTSGTIYATNQTIQNADYAENYISSQKLLPGEIVMTAKDGNNNAVIRTTLPYQPETIGVISTNPGITLNSNAQIDGKHSYIYPIALSGRVPVLVSGENGAIRTGDFITTSSIAGVGMRSTKAGVVIGKALEDFDMSTGKTGTILVYINVGWANPSVVIASDGTLQIPESTISMPSSPTSAPPLGVGISWQDKVASLSSQIQRIDDLSSRIASLEKQLSLATSLSQLSQKASPSAFVDMDTATVSGRLSVLGRTLLSEVGITGKITAGLVTINGLDISNGTSTATINTAGSPLKLQSLEMAGLDILNGKITIDTSGNMQVNASVTVKKVNIDTEDSSTASAGKAIIQKGKTTVEIATKSLTNSSLIFATPDTIPVAIAKKQLSSDAFELTIAQPLAQDLRVDWWIVN